MKFQIIILVISLFTVAWSEEDLNKKTRNLFAACPSGMYTGASGCLSCATAIPNCVACGGVGACTACATGFTLTAGACVQAVVTTQQCLPGTIWDPLTSACVSTPITTTTVTGVGYGAGMYGAGLYGAGAYGAGLYGAGAYGAGAYGAGLYGAGLYGAGMYGAGAYGAGLYGAGLYGGGLYGAGLYGAGYPYAGVYGAGYPVAAPIATPVAAPIATPVVTPVATPVATPIATPVVTPIATPVVTATPVVAAGVYAARPLATKGNPADKMECEAGKVRVASGKCCNQGCEDCDESGQCTKRP